MRKPLKRQSSLGVATVSTIALLMALIGAAMNVQAQNATELLARHTALHEQLADNPFGRPVYLESEQNHSRLSGDIYAEITQPYPVVGSALQTSANWCDILILHLNTKSCRAFSASTGDVLKLHIGRKTDQPLTSAEPIDFDFHVTANTTNYLQVALDAEEGPVGTHHYRILLEVVSIDAASSFLHLSYSYEYNMMARLAMQGYLSTAGRSKVGFSIIGYDNGKPEYANGMRGVVERNTMRYYLAVESYLGALSSPSDQQAEKRLNDWFDRSEQYAMQLHEIDKKEYLTMKRDEIKRQDLSGENE